MEETITMSKEEFDKHLEDAAKKGARAVLTELGLDDINAVHDIKDLRDLLSAYKTARSIVWKNVINYATLFILGAFSYGVFMKWKL